MVFSTFPTVHFLKKSSWIKYKMTSTFSAFTAIFWRFCELDTYFSALHDIMVLIH